MLTEQNYHDLEKWLKYPHLHKKSLKDAAKTGLVSLALQDSDLPDSLRQQLLEKTPIIYAQLEHKDLFRLYRSLKNRSTYSLRTKLNRFEEQFIRTTPTQRLKNVTI
jgi:hypothetical protein